MEVGIAWLPFLVFTHNPMKISRSLFSLIKPRFNVLKQGKLIEFLNTLDVECIPYVSWKNNHELQYSISGESDIDLYIPHEYRSSFLNLAIQENWLCVENPIARYPWVTHLYTYDETLKW